jgi:hypothetical protein
VAANPNSTVAFAAGLKKSVARVVESTVIAMVSPASPLPLYVLVDCPTFLWLGLLRLPVAQQFLFRQLLA